MGWREIEEDVIDIITAAVPASVRVMSASDVTDMLNRTQFAPSVQVLYGGFSVVDSHTKAVAITNRFDVVVCMRSALEQGGNQIAKLSAADLSELVVAHLIGKTVDTARRNAIKCTGAPQPVANAGYVYIPTSYEVSSVIKAI
jgi:hypothetical protein